jgi:hypothetical protein
MPAAKTPFAKIPDAAAELGFAAAKIAVIEYNDASATERLNRRNVIAKTPRQPW